MSENKANVKGMFIPFPCWYALSQLQGYDELFLVLDAYCNYLQGEDYDKLYNDLNTPFEQAMFIILVNYAGTREE